LLINPSFVNRNYEIYEIYESEYLESSWPVQLQTLTHSVINTNNGGKIG